MANTLLQLSPVFPVQASLVSLGLSLVSLFLPLGERRKKGKKDAICAKYLPKRESMSAVHSHVSHTTTTTITPTPQFILSTSNMSTPQFPCQESSGTHPQGILADWLSNIQKPNKGTGQYRNLRRKIGQVVQAIGGEIVENFIVKEGFTEEEEMNLNLEE